jgi:predicted nucleic acid-binding protein
MDLIADTSYLVGLWRGQAWAKSHATANPSKSLGIPWTVLGEFWHGSVRAGHDKDKVRAFLEIGIPLIDPLPVIPAYASLCAGIQSHPQYRNIGQNDLWIAAVALAHNRPLVSRNLRHFGIIPALRVEVLQP